MHPTTQQLVDLVRSHAKPKDSILDMGCGDGVIAHALKDFDVTGVDIQPQELEVPFIQSDLFENVTGKFDVIVCTLPNQPTEEVQGHDPVLVDGGEVGFEILARFIDQVGDYLYPGGEVIMAISPGQERFLEGWEIIDGMFAVFSSK